MYRALRSFSGLVSMIKGEVKDIPNKWIAKDLLACGYIEAVEETVPAKEEKKETKPKKKKAPKGE